MERVNSLGYLYEKVNENKNDKREITVDVLNFPWYRHWHPSMRNIYELSKHCNDQCDIIKCSSRQLSIASFLRSNYCSVPDIYYLFNQPPPFHPPPPPPVWGINDVKNCRKDVLNIYNHAIPKVNESFFKKGSGFFFPMPLFLFPFSFQSVLLKSSAFNWSLVRLRVVPIFSQG